MFVNIGDDKIWDLKTVKLRDITIDNEPKFNEHISNVCVKAQR